MTYYPRSAYGSNPLPGADRNGDNGWGGYQWPGGVPAHLLATIRKGDVKLVVRKELAELLTLLLTVTEDIFGYDIIGGWTWSYENRPIGGTRSASNHSRARAVDLNAPENPMSYTWQCNIPPKVVSLWERCKMFWGGRYNGKTDTMHFEGVMTPAEVAGIVAWLKSTYFSGGANVPKPPDPTPAPRPSTPAADGPATGSLKGKKTYRIRKGDTLGEIAKRAGATVKQLSGWNGLKDPNNIPVGKLITLVKLTPPKPAPKPSKPTGPLAPKKGRKPGFPLPRGYYFGPKSGPNNSVSGMAKSSEKWRPSIKLIQTYLNLTGEKLKVDGMYGDATIAAVKRFQKKWMGPKAADGLTGPATWLRMGLRVK